MTELAVLPQYPPAEVVHFDPTGGRLVAWAEAASAANQLARALVRTSFVPESFKTVRDADGNIDPGNATAAIIMGDELGLSPLAALRGIYVFKGTPAMYARTMRALALSHGHQMWNEKSTDDEVVVCGRRRGSDKVERVSWTFARAKKAGYTSNQKYLTDPQGMLQAKADSEVARKIAADVLAGVPHSIEDLELEPSPDAQVAARAPGTTKVARRKPAEPQPIPEPDMEPPGEPEPALLLPADEPPAGATELIRPAQTQKMQILFREKGFTDRDDRLGYVRDVVGVDVESSKDLTVAQASVVIDALDKLDGPE